MDKIIALPLIKNYSSRKEWENVCWQEIIKSEKILKLFVTQNERHNIVMRIAALDGLISGKSYKNIGDELWLSPQTISGIKKALQENKYRSYLERSKNDRRRKQYGSKMSNLKSQKLKHSGKAHKTKYGTIYSEYF
jgi:uncharacterized protein YerC